MGFSLDYWYVFPSAVFVAIVANASGFSGGVLFQPFFNFVLQLPLGRCSPWATQRLATRNCSRMWSRWLRG